MGAFLARTGAIETPECWCCGEEEQSAEHLYTSCWGWRKGRRKIVREFYKAGIKWQAQTERKWLAELLANEKATKPLLFFSQTTEIGEEEEQGRGS